jgi:hypothetical protein
MQRCSRDLMVPLNFAYSDVRECVLSHFVASRKRAPNGRCCSVCVAHHDDDTTHGDWHTRRSATKASNVQRLHFVQFATCIAHMAGAVSGYALRIPCRGRLVITDALPSLRKDDIVSVICPTCQNVFAG